MRTEGNFFVLLISALHIYCRKFVYYVWEFGILLTVVKEQHSTDGGNWLPYCRYAGGLSCRIASCLWFWRRKREGQVFYAWTGVCCAHSSQTSPGTMLLAWVTTAVQRVAVYPDTSYTLYPAFWTLVPWKPVFIEKYLIHLVCRVKVIKYYL
jgi:hypothetical protein